MKSIIQEASSVIKAVEKAWQSAGQPKEFSIKVYEEAQKNFIGMTVKSAKIGIFFQEEAPTRKNERSRREPYKHKPKDTQRIEPKKPKKVAIIEEKPLAPTEEKIFKKRIIWTDEMVQAAKKWVTQALGAMEKPDISYNTDVNNYYLRFVFNKPVAQTDAQERELFRSFSFLMLQALKRKFKRPLRGFKIVLTR